MSGINRLWRGQPSEIASAKSKEMYNNSIKMMLSAVVVFVSIYNVVCCKPVSAQEVSSEKLGSVSRPSEAADRQNEAASNALSFIRTGRTLLRQGDYKGSISTFETSIQLFPWPNAYEGLATAYMEMGKNEQSFKYYTLAGSGVTDPILHLKMALYLVDIKEYGQSIKAFQSAMHLMRFDDAQILRNLSFYASSFTAKSETTKRFKSAIYVALGMNRSRVQQYDMAIKEYESAINIQPNFAIAYLQMGHLLKRMGKTQEARKSYEAVVALGDGSIKQSAINAMEQLQN